MTARLPENEAERLAALRERHILDTPPEEGFDDLVRLAAYICDVPIAAVSLVDADRQWFKAITGLETRGTPRDIAFCAHTILQSDPMIVADAAEDSRFADNPLVTGEPHIRFYAGVPLITDDGHALGSLCVIDRVPRQLTPAQQESLRALGRQARAQLELRRRLAFQERLAEERQLSEAKFRSIIDVSPVPYALNDERQNITFLNAEFVRTFGYTLEDIPTLADWWPKAYPDPEYRRWVATTWEARLQAARETGAAFEPLELAVCCRDGTERTVIASAAALGPSFGETHLVVLYDITARKKVEQALAETHSALAESEARQRAILEHAPVILYAADAAGTVTLSEGTGLTALGLTPGEAVGRSVFEFTGGEPEREAPTRRALGGESVSFDASVGGLWLHTELRPVRNEAGTVTGIIGVCLDVTERALAEERFRVLFEKSSDAHLLCGPVGIIDCNNATLGMMGCPDKAQLLGTHPALLSPDFQPDGSRSAEAGRAMEVLAREHGSHHFEWTHRRIDGAEFPSEVWLTPVMLADGPAMLAVLHDLTERKRAEQQALDYAIVLEFQKEQIERANVEMETANARLADLATTDGLTGLKNHRAFRERLAEEVSRAARYGTPLSLVLLDVDHFKPYNDTYGHPAGDVVLRTVASLLKACARDTDIVARYGGEEFVLILPQTDSLGAAVFAERLRASIAGYPWPNRAVTASFGVAVPHLGEESAVDLVSRADKALYQSKTAGRNRITVACDLPLPIEAQGNSRFWV